VPAGADEDVHLGPAPHDGEGNGDAAPLARAERRSPLRQVVERAEVDPGRGECPRRRRRVGGPRGLGVGHVPADGRRPRREAQPGVGEDAAQRPAPPAPGDEGTHVEAEGRAVGQRVQRTEPPHAGVLLRPVGCAGERGGDGGGHAGADEHGGRRPQRRDGVEHTGRDPAAHRHLDQHRVQRVPEPRPVQQVLEPLGPQRRVHRPPCGLDDLVEGRHVGNPVEDSHQAHTRSPTPTIRERRAGGPVTVRRS
jgi:hypothetical protein